MIKKIWMSFITILFLSLLQTTYALNVDLNIDKIIIFGDSLSDNGNIFSLTSTAHKAISRVPIIPKGPPYFAGRFSNGPVWVENLAQVLNVPLVDYAYAGSWAEPYHDSKLIIPFSLDMQVNFYLMTAPLDRAKEKHLYVIWSGGNDYVDGRKDIEYATTNAVNSIKKQIEWLVYFGAKHFLILNEPDLGITPYVISRGAKEAAQVSELSHKHNLKLAQMIKEQQALNPTIDFVSIDIETYFTDMIIHPDQYNFKNVTQACYEGANRFKNLMNNDEIEAAKESNIDILNTPSFRVAYSNAQMTGFGVMPCRNPEVYLFWDILHPTQIAHQHIAKLALKRLNEKGIV